MIDRDVLSSILSPKNWIIEHLESIDSTNAELYRRYRNSDKADRIVLWAEEQTVGRGRLKRKWFSVPHADITASVCFPAPVHPSDIPKLSLCAGLALVKILRDEFGLESQMRWPNDILTVNGKLAGILSAYLSTPNAVICGIGINVNSRPDDIVLDKYGKRTTLLHELGREVSRESVLGLWLPAFEKFWCLADGNRIEELRVVFDSVNFYSDRTLKILPGAGMDRESVDNVEELKGTACGLDPSGALQVRLNNGEMYSVSVEDVLVPL